MVDQNAINIAKLRHVIMQYTMEYYAILIFCAGICFVLDYNNNL